MNDDDPKYLPGERTDSPEPIIKDESTNCTYIKPEFDPDNAFELQLIKDIGQESVQATSATSSTSRVKKPRQPRKKNILRDDSTSNGGAGSHRSDRSNHKGSKESAVKSVRNRGGHPRTTSSKASLLEPASSVGVKLQTED
jgi:hypothetical protein